MSKTLEQLEVDMQDAERKVEHAQALLLRADGWELTCRIASTWLWTKQVEGQVVYVGKDTALRFTQTHMERPQAEALGEG